MGWDGQMIVSLITNDIGVAGATDWMAKTGHGSNKPSVNAVEPSFVQIMTSLAKGAAPIPPQMDMADQGSEQPPMTQDIGSLDMAVTDEDSEQFLLAMVASVGSDRVVLDPQIAGAATGIVSVQAANGDAAGDTALPITVLAAEAPNDDGTLATAIDLGFGENGLAVLDSTRLALDGAVDVPFTQMPVESVFHSVKKMKPVDWKLTGERQSYNVTYQVVGIDAGPGLDPLSNLGVTADNGVNGADPQLGPLGPVAVDQSTGALPSKPQGQADLSTPIATPELSASVVRGQSADTAVPITVSKLLVDTDVTPLQTGPSGEAAGDVQEDAVTQQQAARAATATPGNGAASLNQADNKQESGVVQQDVMTPDHATSAIQVSKTAQLVAGAALGAVQQVTVLRQPLSLTFGPDPLPPIMTLIDIASGGAGAAPQGGSGQTGAGVAGQGAASLLLQMETALDVRQQGWTKTLVNRVINAAQAGGSLTIKIIPAHLGQITLRLSEGKRGTDLRIIADVPATASMLRDVQNQLSSAFEDAGLTLGAYSASTGNNGGEGSQKDGHADQVTSSELAIDAAQGANDVAGVDNLSRINILL